MRASAPTQACLLATCSTASFTADTGSLVCSPTGPCRYPPKLLCLAFSGLMKDQSGEHNSIYWAVFDWQPCRGGTAMQLRWSSRAARTNTKLTLTPHIQPRKQAILTRLYEEHRFQQVKMTKSIYYFIYCIYKFISSFLCKHCCITWIYHIGKKCVTLYTYFI